MPQEMAMIPTYVILGFLLLFLLVSSLKSFGINQEYQRGVLFRLGRLGAMKGPGWYWLIPYVDRDFSYYPVGQMYPSDFNYYNVPYQYQSYYPDGGNMLYRYGDGAIYGLNPQTQAVQSIVALLAGDLGVGQRLPMGYSAYNLPLQYRSQ